MRRLVSAAAGALLVVACTNDYEDFRFPRNAPASTKEDAAVPAEPDAGVPADASFDVTASPEAP